MVISIVAAVLLAAFSILKKALTIPAAVLAGMIMILIGYCGNYKDVMFLAISYLVLIAIDMVVGRISAPKISDVHKKSGTRTVVQLLANGGCATVAIVLYKITHDIAFLFVYEICVMEACADSVASDVGVLSRRDPISIITLKKVSTGMSGGVSLLGLSASLISCAFMAVFASFSSGLRIKNMILLALIAFMGMIIDSVLGAALQVKYKCSVCGKATERTEHCEKATEYVSGIKFIDNSFINLLTNLITGVLGYFIVKAVL